MKTHNKFSNMIALQYWVLLALGMLVSGILSASGREEGNGVKPGLFLVEPPTLISLGFEWYVEGDHNHTASVEVSYRKKSESAWKDALPLLRINKEESIFSFINNRIDYITPNMFAGSILDLEPDTEYECRFRMSDPDGVDGKKTVTRKKR